MLDAKKIKKEFPLFNGKTIKKPLIFLDNASTTQKPECVIEAMDKFYRETNANVHRGIYKLSEDATTLYEDAHQKVADLINADFEEIIFTKSSTESLNLLAYTISKRLKKGDKVILTQMEHHSNLVPWQQMAKEKGFKVEFVKVINGKLDMDHLKEIVDEKTRIVSVVHISNVLGTINPVKEIAKIAHEKGAKLIVDGAQSVPHIKIDVKEIDCDFLVFSGHKMLGPTGIGVLYGKKELLEEMDPFLFGGDMISEVSFRDSKWNDLPWKFEAGTPNIAEAVGLSAAIDYLNNIGMKNIEEHEKALTDYAMNRLKKIKNLTIYGPEDDRIGVISFNIEGIHPHDLATLLDRENIAVRGGHHCAMPLMDVLGLQATTRISFYLYNTREDIDKLIDALKKAKEVFKIE